jgi:transcriptional regulator with XRE-family HTH domain
VEKIQPNFGIRIRKLRLDQGLSQFQLAELVGLSEDQIGKIERGKSWVGEQTLALLSAALLVPQQSLFDYSENEVFLSRVGFGARAPRKAPRLVVRRGRLLMQRPKV